MFPIIYYIADEDDYRYIIYLDTFDAVLSLCVCVCVYMQLMVVVVVVDVVCKVLSVRSTISRKYGHYTLCYYVACARACVM